jgi:hypothetical protein
MVTRSQEKMNRIKTRMKGRPEAGLKRLRL